MVLLNTGLDLDDHEDVDVPATSVHRVDHLMTPERNLEVQTRIISDARAFVGTYGGLAYLGPFYGVPSIGFYSKSRSSSRRIWMSGGGSVARRARR